MSKFIIELESNRYQYVIVRLMGHQKLHTIQNRNRLKFMKIKIFLDLEKLFLSAVNETDS